jgi:hypothetical protein
MRGAVDLGQRRDVLANLPRSFRQFLFAASREKTRAPSWTNLLAVASPMPLLLPVTSAIFPFNLPI